MSENDRVDIAWGITGNRSIRIHAVRRGMTKSVCGATPNPKEGWRASIPEGVDQSKYRRCPVCVRRLSANQ